MSFEPRLLRQVSELIAPDLSLGPLSEAERQLLIRSIDLTTLGAADLESKVRSLCHQAVEHQVAAVCVFPQFVECAGGCVSGSGVKVATVGGAFPHGLGMPFSVVSEAEWIVRELSIDELDITIPRHLALTGRFDELYDWIASIKDVASGVTLKVILSVSELGEPEVVYQAAMVAMMADCDFVKTSTGKEGDIATQSGALAMVRAIEAFREETGQTVGFKAAGGIREPEDAVWYLRLTLATLGQDWASRDRFRIGASALLDKLVGLADPR